MRRTPAAALALALLAAPLAAQNAPAGEAAPAPAAPTTQAASPETEATVRRLASELRCPVCQGLSIEDSPTELSTQMKDVIRQQLATGKSPAEVKAYFVGRYGEWILLEPEPKGFNLLAYLLPVLGLAAGGALVVVTVRRWSRPPAADAPVLPTPDGDHGPPRSS